MDSSCPLGDGDDEGDGGEEVSGGLVVTGGDGAPVLEATEGLFDQVALPVGLG